jgi:B12-binding domain/radical SAM domain protein
MVSAVIFDYSKKNFYSLTPLVATLDSIKDFQELDILLEEDINSLKIRNLLQKYEKLIIAFSFRTAQFEDIYYRMKTIFSSLNKPELDRVIFIAGGSHPSGSPYTTLKSGFDFAFIGEAEYSLTEFVQNYLQSDDLFKSSGVGYLEDDSLVLTPRPAPIMLDEYPFISKKRKLYPPLEISRGCSFGCTFCQVPKLFQHRIRHRSPEVVLDIIKWMGIRKLNDIRFITPNSFGYMSSKPREVNTEAILYLLNSIKSTPGIDNVYFGTFPGEVRPETVSKGLMSEIKPIISNTRISIGLQSGSNEVLKDIRRGHTVEEGINAIGILDELGFTPIVDIIIGLPGATEENEMETINVIKRLIKKRSIIRAHVFMPLPGTALENTEFKPVYPSIKKILGKLSSQGKIEGNWSNQEKYALKAWELSRRIANIPPIQRR